jgi:8-oxo-dGTP diphosphatase
MVAKSWREDQQRAIDEPHMDDLFDSRTLAAAASPDAVSGPVLHTARLTLRPLAPDDAPVFHRLINDWDICRKLPDAPFPYPASLAGEWIAAAAADRAAGRAEQFAVIETATGGLIGSAGLRLSRDKKSADLGYWLAKRCWSQGFGLEVAVRLASWGFAALSVLKITATVAADNEPSVKVLLRAGFVPAGKGQQIFSCRPGTKLPVLHYTLSREAPPETAPKIRNILLVAACALVDGQGRILLARRPEGKKLAGLWEFPGGKMNPGETPEAALVRELHEELGIEVAEKNLAPFVFASHPYETFHLLMPVFLCRRWKGTPKPREGQALAWVEAARLAEYPMPPADRPLIPMLRDFL